MLNILASVTWMDFLLSVIQLINHFLLNCNLNLSLLIINLSCRLKARLSCVQILGLDPFCNQFACSPCLHGFSLGFLRLPPTVTMFVRLIGQSKLSIVWVSELIAVWLYAALRWKTGDSSSALIHLEHWNHDFYQSRVKAGLLVHWTATGTDNKVVIFSIYITGHFDAFGPTTFTHLPPPFTLFLYVVFK